MNQKSKQLIFRILTALFGIAFIILLLVIFKNLVAGRKAKNDYDSLASMVNDTSTMDSASEDTSSEETESEENKIDELVERGITVPLKNTDWDAMQKMNKDIYAWIYVPNTNVDYPVLQHPTDDEYYLDHNLDGSGPRPACIFSMMFTSKDFTNFNSTIYGHNIKGSVYDGTMFSTLHKFENADFFNNEENRYIYIYQAGGKPLVYEVFAAVEFVDDVIDFRYYFEKEDERERYIKELKAVNTKKSHVRKEMNITKDDHILTLATCITNQPKKYLVVGVLVNPSALKKQ